jgi:hypothetical protein
MVLVASQASDPAAQASSQAQAPALHAWCVGQAAGALQSRQGSASNCPQERHWSGWAGSQDVWSRVQSAVQAAWQVASLQHWGRPGTLQSVSFVHSTQV